MKKSRKTNLKEHTIWFRPGFEFRPLIAITERVVTRIGAHVFQQINHVVHFEIEDKRDRRDGGKDPKHPVKAESGLDCSGQGECQPGIVPSDGDDMQSFLVKANKKPRCQRNQTQRKTQKKQAGIN